MLAEKTYNFDLPTLFRLVQDQSVILSTEVTVPHIRGLCYGYLFFRERTIVDCQIQSPDGKMLYRGEEAYAILNTRTQWLVRFDSVSNSGQRSGGWPETAKQQAKASSPVPDTYVPRTIAALEAPLLDGFTMKQRVILRTVFAMINGHRNIAQMKEQLHLSPAAIDEALTSLRAIGVIK